MLDPTRSPAQILFILILLLALLPGLASVHAADQIRDHTTSTKENTAKPVPFQFDNLTLEQQRSLAAAPSTDNGNQWTTPDELTYRFRRNQEFIKLFEVFLLTIMCFCTLLIVLKCMKDSKICKARDMLNGIGLVLVVFATVMVILLADVDAQLSAAMGVLGGIAGYLFGTLRSSASHDDTPPASEPESLPPADGKRNQAKGQSDTALP